MPELPATIGGRYRPLRVLGRGGMGVVYEVEHVHTRERLALKVLTGADRSRFRREARSFTSIRSEFVVRITDADTAPELDDAPFLVMELLDGADLATLLRQRGAQAPADVARWMGEAAAGLSRAHAAGIVHRDLKPANLFLSSVDGGLPRLKVLDFGVAKMAENDDLRTSSGALVGTPRYMAPEQARGEGAEVGPASDVWALGMIAFVLVGGRRYFQGETMAEVIAQVLFDPIVAPSARGCDLGPRFDAWFLRSCARDPASRFASVTEQARDLALALRDVPAPGVAGRSELSLDATATSTGSERRAGGSRSRVGAHRAASASIAASRRPARWAWLVAALFTAGAGAALLARGSPDRGAPSPATPSAAAPAISPEPPQTPAPALAPDADTQVSPVPSASGRAGPPVVRGRGGGRPAPPDPFAGQK